MFDLPKSTIIKRVIPKNAFDAYTNSKQKKMFADKVLRIIWMNTLSMDTVNLASSEMEEIQLLDIELKEKSDIGELLNIVQKSIPYYIVIVVRYGNEYYISTAAKHRNPIRQNMCVINYVFKSNWVSTDDKIKYKLILKNNLDWVFKNFCEQLASRQNDESKSLGDLVAENIAHDKREKEIAKLKSQISRCKQFNKKVELNLRLNELMNEKSEYK